MDTAYSYRCLSCRTDYTIPNGRPIRCPHCDSKDRFSHPDDSDLLAFLLIETKQTRKAVLERYLKTYFLTK